MPRNVALPPAPSVSPDRLAVEVSRLRDEHGLDFAVTRRVVGLLADGTARTTSQLVAGSGASRRWVEEIQASLAGWLERAGDRVRISPGYAEAVREAVRGPGGSLRPGFGPDTPADPQWTDLVAAAREAASGLPPSVWGLDHVPATAETAARRAYALWANYDLAGRHVLCLGDHDLTSVALTRLDPSVTVSVVDVDERIIGHIGDLARRWNLPIRAAFADLRAELPPSLAGQADLVFTDPPYTPAGIELFLARGIAALRRRRGSRLLFCYSHNERQLARGLEVQNVVGRLQLTIEALLPGFNAFDGAESIGSRSALWVCQPTGNAWAAAQRRAAGTAAIYTRGRQAEETAGVPGVLQRLREYAGDRPDVQTVAAAGPADLTLDALLRTEAPAGQGGMLRPGATLLADLTAVHASYAYRLLLRGPAVGRALLAVSGPGLPVQAHPVWRLLGARYTIRRVAMAGVDGTVVDVAARADAAPEPEGFVARYVLDHPKARLAGAWREALVARARRAGATLSKNEARQHVVAQVEPGLVDGRYLCELPEPVLARVCAALTTAGTLP